MSKKIIFSLLIIILFNPIKASAHGPMPSEIARDMLSVDAFSMSPIDNNFESEQDVIETALYIRPSYVRIQIGNHYGEGTIISVDEDEIRILTAAHVMRVYTEKDMIYTVFYNGLVKESKLLYIDENVDAALISVPTSEIDPSDLIHLKSAPISEKAFNAFEKKSSEIVIALDSEPCAFPEKNQNYDFYGNGTKVAESYIYGTAINTNILVTNFGYKMLYAKCSAHEGMSGGGVFDINGNLVGVLAGGTENDEMVAVRLVDVIKVLSYFEAASTHELSGK
ncbi:S1 family peptidase [Butyrivibrio sp. MB2005]|uniref:S1 family peptidase n=1 Tax=Butyrivibrio sp. MB2005 TaxID=1280678 RepID=UPI000408DFD5|nr:serine protease [Butyrivibrio sp. MB2005]